MKIIVIGGGVVGLCCALALRRRGADVIVFERGACDGGASLGNAGLITPGFSTPLSAPGTVRRALRWALDSESPFLVRPRLDPRFAAWCLRFATNCSPQSYTAGTRALLRLNARTFELFDDLRAHGVNFDMHSVGVLFVARTSEGLEEYEEAFDHLLRHGYPGHIEQLNAVSVQRLEPALGEDIVGGVLAPIERHVRPENLIAGLVQALRADGVEIFEQAPVRQLRRSRRGWRVSTLAGEAEAERVLVTAGAWSNEILSLVRQRIPLEGAKGYSITATGSGTAPRRPVYLTEAKITCTPFGDALRLAGKLELTGLDLTLSSDRLSQLRKASERYLKDWKPETIQLEWCGLRPLAPDGLPIIGELSSAPGLFIATGHGMLGLTLGPATAEALSPVILGNQPRSPELDPFSPQRFQRRRPGFAL